MKDWNDFAESAVWQDMETGETYEPETVSDDDMAWYLDVFLGGQYVNVCHTTPEQAASALCGCGGHPYL